MNKELITFNIVNLDNSNQRSTEPIMDCQNTLDFSIGELNEQGKRNT